MTFDERMDRIAEMLDHVAERQIRTEDHFAAMDERFEAMEERYAAMEALSAAESARHDRANALIQQQLTRAIRLSVEETRRERLRRRELDDKLTQLASAQLLTEQQVKATQATLQAFIESLRKPGNGHKQ